MGINYGFFVKMAKMRVQPFPSNSDHLMIAVEGMVRKLRQCSSVFTSDSNCLYLLAVQQENINCLSVRRFVITHSKKHWVHQVDISTCIVQVVGNYLQ